MQVFYNKVDPAPNIHIFAAQRRKTMQAQGSRYAQLPGPVSVTTARVLAHALEKNKKARFGTARAFREALMHSLSNGGEMSVVSSGASSAAVPRPLGEGGGTGLGCVKLYDVVISYRLSGGAEEAVATRLFNQLKALPPTLGPFQEKCVVFLHRSAALATSGTIQSAAGNSVNEEGSGAAAIGQSAEAAIMDRSTTTRPARRRAGFVPFSTPSEALHSCHVFVPVLSPQSFAVLEVLGPDAMTDDIALQELQQSLQQEASGGLRCILPVICAGNTGASGSGPEASMKAVTTACARLSSTPVRSTNGRDSSVQQVLQGLFLSPHRQVHCVAAAAGAFLRMCGLC